MNLLEFFILIFVASVGWSIWSLKDLKSPKNFYPKLEGQVRKLLSGVIILPKKGS